jgi:hypothetical protein
VTTAIVRHAVDEEQVLFPAVRAAVPHSAIDVTQGVLAHCEIKELLRDLGEAGAASAEFEALEADLTAAFHQVILDEEYGMSPGSPSSSKTAS